MNLIVSCPRHFESETVEEINRIIEELGDDNPEISITDISGLLTVKTQVVPLEIIKKIREKISDEPWSIRYILRAIPIQVTTKTSVEEIVENSLELASIMKEEQAYRITIEKRNSNVSKSELISKIAEGVKNKVSLEKYDWIILVEILGNKTGISVVKDSDIVSIEKEKRSLSE